MIRPCSSTIMQSEFRTVERRCAITKVVLPFIRRSIPCCTNVSVLVSIEEVASSKINTGGSATAALAIAKADAVPDLSFRHLHLTLSDILLVICAQSCLHSPVLLPQYTLHLLHPDDHNGYHP